MVSSLLLLFMSLAKAKLETISGLGVQLKLGQPEVFLWGLIASTIYFVYRYALYLLQEPGRPMREEFVNALNGRALPLVLRYLGTHHPGVELAEPTFYGMRFSSEGITRSGWPISLGVRREGVAGTESLAGNLPLRMVWRAALRAGFVAIFCRSYFTDYVFPFLLAFVGVVYCAYSQLSGIS